MKITPSSVLLSLLSVLYYFSSVSLATSSSTSIEDKFLHCLVNSPVSSPISIATYTLKNSSFSSVLHSYARNQRFWLTPTPPPSAIVTAMDESHVQATVNCSRNLGLVIKIRSGGHDYEGLSYVSNVTFVILDMSNLREINVDLASETMWAQAGATLGEIYYNIANKTQVLAFPAGVCSTVGAGGHFSGGGYGNLMRKHGLSIDNIIDARIVDSEGRILDRESMGEDLFWAIRGGGGASFAVILSWRLRLVAVPNPVTVFRVFRIANQSTADIVYKWEQVATKLPEDLYIRLQHEIVNGTVQVEFIGLYLGSTETLVPLMNERFPELGLMGQDCLEMPWINSTLFWEYRPVGTSADVLLDRQTGQATFFKYSSDYVRTPISKAGLELIWKKIGESEKFFMQWNPHGGKMGEIGLYDTPYAHRDALFLIEYLIFWTEEGANVSNHNVEISKSFRNFVTPYVSSSPREAYLNYRDLDIGSSPYSNATYEEALAYGVKYFKGNFRRLVQVKTRVDPSNFFRNEQSIPPFSKNSNLT